MRSLGRLLKPVRLGPFVALPERWDLTDPISKGAACEWTLAIVEDP